jgi:uncharacterized coiled-coil DUF342 family protein
MSDIKAQLDQIKDLQRARFWELEDARNEIIARVEPLKQERDQLAPSLALAEKKEWAARIKDAEAGLYDIDVERGEISKALRDPDGKTRLGPRPS